MNPAQSSEGVTRLDLPPRPNLGPEPWPETDWATGLIGAGILLASLMIGVAVLVLGKRRRKTEGVSQAMAGPDEPEDAGTPRGRLVRAAEVIRTALVHRHGPSWAAKTTEEVAAETALGDWLGGERGAEVVGLLARADEAKFAGLDGDFDAAISQGELEAWESLASIVREAAAGATSISKGKWSEPTGGPRRRSVTARSEESKA